MVPTCLPQQYAIASATNDAPSALTLHMRPRTSSGRDLQAGHAIDATAQAREDPR